MLHFFHLIWSFGVSGDLNKRPKIFLHGCLLSQEIGIFIVHCSVWTQSDFSTFAFIWCLNRSVDAAIACFFISCHLSKIISLHSLVLIFPLSLALCVSHFLSAGVLSSMVSHSETAHPSLLMNLYSGRGGRKARERNSNFTTLADSSSLLKPSSNTHMGLHKRAGIGRKWWNKWISTLLISPHYLQVSFHN